jgi:hypothetical protein
MRSKALIIVLLIVLLFLLALSLTASLNGGLVLYYREGTTLTDYLPLGQCVARTLALLAFTLIYCKTWYSGESPGNAFADLFLLSAALVETKSFYLYTDLTGMCFIAPSVLSRIQIGAVVLMLVSMISSSLFYQNNEYSAVSFLKGVCVVIALTAGLLLPLPLSYKEIFRTLPSFWIFIILCATAFISCLILMFTDTPGIGTFKHLASITIIEGIFATFFFNLSYAELVGSILLTIGYIANAVLSARNSIRL